MSKLFEQMVKAIEDGWPKALLGLIVPAAQFGWRLWQERQIEHRKKTLRDRITGLSQFRQAHFDDSPQAAQIKQDADQEYALAIAELAEISSSQQQAVSANLPPSHWLRRWLLLYIPRRRMAWIPHTLFFITLTTTLMGLLGVLIDFNDPETGAALLGLAMFFAFALLFRKWAIRANEGPGRVSAEHSRRRHTWIPTTVIVSAIVIGCFALVGFSTDDSSDDISLQVLANNLVPAIITSGVFAIIATAAWVWRRRWSR